MTDLIAFMRARLDEDEVAATKAYPKTWRPSDRGAGVESAEPGPPESYRMYDMHLAVANMMGTVGKFEIERINAVHVARWDPAHVLAEVAAKRAIIERHESNARLLARATEHGDDLYRAVLGTRVSESYQAVKILAQPHAEHPDFDPGLEAARMTDDIPRAEQVLPPAPPREAQVIALTDPGHEHAWVWHQPPDASRAPMVGICRDCGAIDFDSIAAWDADRAETRTVTALAHLQEGHVYAVGLPDGATIQDHIEQLRQVQEWTGARIVVHAPGVTMTELTDTALRDSELALHHQRCAVREHEQRAELLRRQVDERTDDVARLAAEIEHLDAELADVRAAPTVHRHADDSLSVDWPEGAVSCLMTREILDGILLERATLRAQVDQLRGLLTEALDLGEDRGTWADSGGTLSADRIAEIRREAGLA